MRYGSACMTTRVRLRGSESLFPCIVRSVACGPFSHNRFGSEIMYIVSLLLWCADLHLVSQHLLFDIFVLVFVTFDCTYVFLCCLSLRGLPRGDSAQSSTTECRVGDQCMCLWANA